MTHITRIRPFLKTLGNPAMLFYALPWLMILLVAGTVAQRDLGLYEAQELFFSSWIFWLGPLPLPGAHLTLAAITLSLLVKFLFFSPWKKTQAGILLTHLGVLILLAGGLVTSLSQTEGFMAIREGQQSAAVSDYHARILRVERDGSPFLSLPFEGLEKGAAVPDLPFTARIDRTCGNCRPAPARENPDNRGLAQDIALFDAPPEKDAETNLSGVTLRISGAGEGQDGVYVTMEEIPHRPEIKAGGGTYTLSVMRAQTVLPVTIELTDFRREMHPGTDIARGFTSDVLVHDGAVTWPYTIRMNEPLRYKGYTFYQASFSLRPDGEYSVLSVVSNKGRVFPYLASAIIFAGLLLHIVLRVRRP